MDIFDLPKVDTAARDRAIRDEQLGAEAQALETDRDFYLECLHGQPLKDRTTPQEVRDGLILYWHVYRSIRDAQAKESS